ncbi:unnamed protein product [Linum trigynum]|uniref:Cytochrome P450 n=1 Tax=Linum trigynum TaxID=586398 RepID=A0AAV2CIN7_9ROSI
MQFLFLFPLLAAAVILAKFAYSVLWLPYAIQRHFKAQGVAGPGYRPINGNNAETGRLSAQALSRKPESAAGGIFGHRDVVARVSPFYHEWARTYGKTFLFWFGIRPRLVISRPDDIKQVMLNTSGSFEQARFNPLGKLLFWQGLVGLRGDTWALHRRIISQAFNMERVKEWVPELVACSDKMLEKFEGIRGEREEFEIDAHMEMNDVAADVISKTTLGRSFEEGRRIFALQDQQAHLVAQALTNIYIPGFQFLPTKKNRERARLEKETRESIKALIHRRNERVRGSSRSLIDLLMSPYKNQDGLVEELGVEEVIDECKTFYFAGKETTANLLSFALLMLANHQEWQDKAREEVIRVLGRDKSPVADNLSDLKILNLIIQETLRMYPPAVLLLREATKKVKMGRLEIPTGTEFHVPLIGIHYDSEIWGEDAHEFNPLRFNEPRKHLAHYFPFGMGPRICVGQTLAIVEAKIVLAMIIRNYSFVLSSTYVHAPSHFISLMPQYGAHMVFRKAF